MKIHRPIIVLALCINLLFGVGSEEVLLADIVSNGVEQIKKINDQIKIATDALDNVNKISKAMDQVENLLLESGEKIYNPMKNLQNTVYRLQALYQRFEAFPDKFSKAFGYDRFFKDYHNLTCPSQYTTVENEAFAKLSKQTGITIEELQIRECIYDNLTKAQTQEQKQALEDALNAIIENNFKGANEAIDRYTDITKSQFETNNKDLINANKALGDLYFNFMLKDENGQNKIEKQAKELKKLVQAMSENKSPDITTSIIQTNQILVSMAQTLNDMYEAEMNFYNAWHKLNVFLYGKEIASDEEIKNLQNHQKKTSENPYLEVLKNNQIMEYDELGIPKFKSKKRG